MDIPNTKTLCDAERFIEGLRIIAAECNLKSITHTKLGVVKFEFKDGSTVGGLGAYKEAGLIKII